MNVVKIELDTLDEVRLGSLLSLKILKINNLILHGLDSLEAKFCRIFSRMFPNLEELSVQSDRYYEIELHLGLFGNLRKHKIECLSFINQYAFDFDDLEDFGNDVDPDDFAFEASDIDFDPDDYDLDVDYYDNDFDVDLDDFDFDPEF